MITTPSNLVLIFAAVTTALMAGLFYAWSISVVPGIVRLPDREYIAAMQSMNDAIENPIFFAAFFGAMFLLPISTYMHYSQPMSARFWFLLAASVLYIVGVMGLTMFGNVPLNIALRNFDIPGASAQEIASLRTKFEGPWNNLNSIRTVANILSLVCVILACLSSKDN